VSAAEGLSELLFGWLAETTWQVAVLVLAVAIAQRVLRRWLTPRWSYALWMLVAVRLLLPVLPESPVSVFNVTSAVDPVSVVPAEPETSTRLPPAVPGAAAHTREMAPPLRVGESRDDPQVAGDEGSAAEDAAAKPEPAPARRAGSGPVQLTLPGGSDDLADDMAAGASAGSAPPPSAPFPWRGALVGLWLLGVVFVGLRTVLHERRFGRRIASLQPLRDPHVLALLSESMERAGMRRPVEVVVTEAVRTPALTGLRRPRILLPPQLLATLSDEQLRFVFRHELAHLRCGDGYVNWALALLSALHWFDPFVRFAFARLRAHRESARDWEALSVAAGDAREAYGRTLIQLLETGARSPLRSPALGIAESRSDMRRRITMITKFTHSRRRGPLLVGALAALLIAGPTLTGALRPEVPQGAAGSAALAQEAPSPDSPRAHGLKQVRVERRRRPEAWERRIQEQLDSTVPLDAVNGRTFLEVVHTLRESTGANVVLEEHIRSNYGEDQIDFPRVAEVSGHLILDTLLRQCDVDSCLTGRAIFLGASGGLPVQLEQRIYDIRPLLESRVRAALSNPDFEGWAEADIREQVEGNAAEELLTLILSFGDERAWNRDGASIEHWNRLFLVHQTAEAHEATERFLNLVLNEGRRAPARPEPWETSIRAGLSKVVSVSFDETPIAEAAAKLSEMTGVPIAISGDWADDLTVTLGLEDVPASQVLAWIARNGHAHVSYEEPAAILSETPPLTRECYSVADLTAPRGTDTEPYRDSLVELVRNSVLPVTWESFEGTQAVFWGDLMVVAQTKEVHSELGRFLASLRRALKDG
jgi:beta-lactamase regulating signal transducer with metallopeptidase domain